MIEYISPQTIAIAYLVWLSVCVYICKCLRVEEPFSDGFAYTIVVPILAGVVFVFGKALLGYYN